MNLKRSLIGLGAAFALGAAIISPVTAATTTVGSVPVSIIVTDGGGALSVGLATSSSGTFGSVSVNAVGTTGGVTNAGTKSLALQITGDNKLFNANGFDISIKLQDGYLTLPSQPVFDYSAPANFQIPGRYLKISAVGNPQQAKYTGASSCANPWTGAGTTSAAQCVPRAATGTAPIYKVGDVVGLMGQPDNGVTCRVVSGPPAAWASGCPDPSFSSTTGKLITHFRPGSGTVETDQVIEITLDVPAGVYPGTYSGTLIIEQVVA